jgi:hypothetical protein
MCWPRGRGGGAIRARRGIRVGIMTGLEIRKGLESGVVGDISDWVRGGFSWISF